jgi:hypothetical protein
MYQKIYDFCKVKNSGSIYKNGLEQTNRVKWIINLLKSNNIDYIIDEFNLSKDTKCWNIILPGDSKMSVCAHHDIVNPNSDNANDNSASVINAIMTHVLNPSITTFIVDGEEFGGVGSQRVSEKINSGEYGEIDFVLNYELTGKGGTDFFIGNYRGELFERIINKFDCPVYSTPFNDSVIFRKNNIDSCVINPLPIIDKETSIVNKNGQYLDVSMLYNCHSMSDSVETICTIDMKNFVENISLEILK